VRDFDLGREALIKNKSKAGQLGVLPAETGFCMSLALSDKRTTSKRTTSKRTTSKRTTSMSSGSRSDGINSFSWFHPALPKINLAKIKRCRTLALRGGKQATSETKTGHLKESTKGVVRANDPTFSSPLAS
jgi:hypothetical protein